MESVPSRISVAWVVHEMSNSGAAPGCAQGAEVRVKVHFSPLLMNIEIADFCSTGVFLGSAFGNSFTQDLTCSPAWALFGLAFLIIGIRIPIRGALVAALILIAVATLKLFSAIFGASARSTGSRHLSGRPVP